MTKEKQIALYMEKLDLTYEEALEMSFEGYRFYDLMRVALRRGDPSYLANKIKERDVNGDIKVDLTDKSNWYLKWNNQIGY